MGKLTGWNPKKRPHRIVAPRYTDQELDEPLDLLNFDSAYIERDEILTTRGKLVETFYRHNNFDGGCNAWTQMILDPEQIVGPGKHLWLVIHSHDYYVMIDPSWHGPHGLHRARLMYQQESGRKLWLASAQVGPCYFYSQARVATEYIQILQRQLFYISPDSARKIVAM